MGNSRGARTPFYQFGPLMSEMPPASWQICWLCFVLWQGSTGVIAAVLAKELIARSPRHPQRTPTPAALYLILQGRDSCFLFPLGRTNPGQGNLLFPQSCPPLSKVAKTKAQNYYLYRRISRRR